MKRLLLFCFLLLTSRVYSQDKKLVLQVLESQRKAWNTGDLTGYMQGYWKSDSLLFVGSGGPTYGWKATLEKYQRSYPDKAAMGVLSFDIKEVRFLEPNHAFVLGGWHVKREKDELKGFFTLLLRKINGEWKVIADHSS